MTRIVNTLSEISQNYDALFCDLWGCLHDGIAPFAEAEEALIGFRAKGGKVVLLTNAPRSRYEVEGQLAQMGVRRECWDTIATSGDSARLAMFRGAVGTRVLHIGEPRDIPFFDPIKLLDPCPIVERVTLDDAEGIVCTGPYDPDADLDDLRPELLVSKEKGLKILCANPDIVVDRGDRREWCAGAIAQIYSEMGGESLYFGKPHPPVYELARRRLMELDPTISDHKILAVGDGVVTDVIGAIGENLDVLFVTGGLAAAETETKSEPNPKALERYLSDQQVSPTFAIGKLR